MIGGEGEVRVLEAQIAVVVVSPFRRRKRRETRAGKIIKYN